MTDYAIVDIDAGEIRGNCFSEKEVIKEAQDYYQFLYGEDEDYEKYIPKNWNDAITFFEEENHCVFNLNDRQKREGD